MTQQLDDAGKLQHLLTLEDLPKGVLETLLKRAGELAEHAHGGNAMRDALAGKARLPRSSAADEYSRMAALSQGKQCSRQRHRAGPCVVPPSRNNGAREMPSAWLAANVAICA